MIATSQGCRTLGRGKMAQSAYGSRRAEVWSSKPAGRPSSPGVRTDELRRRLAGAAERAEGWTRAGDAFERTRFVAADVAAGGRPGAARESATQRAREAGGEEGWSNPRPSKAQSVLRRSPTPGSARREEGVILWTHAEG